MRKLREFEIVITPGAIRQALVVVNLLKRKDLLSLSEILHIESPQHGINFTTDLVPGAIRFRERAGFAELFRKARVKPNDVLVFTEVKPGRWRLSVRPVPEDYARKLRQIRASAFSANETLIAPAVKHITKSIHEHTKRHSDCRRDVQGNSGRNKGN